MIWHDLLNAVMLGDKIYALGGYALGVAAYLLVKRVLARWAHRGRLTRFLIAGIALVVGLIAAWLWHDLIEAVQTWYITPLAPHLQLY